MKPKLQCESVEVLKIAGIAYHLDPYFPKSDWHEEFHQHVLVPYMSQSSAKNERLRHFVFEWNTKNIEIGSVNCTFNYAGSHICTIGQWLHH